MATLAHYCTMYGLIEAKVASIPLASATGHVVGAICGYTLNAYITFGVPNRQLQAFGKYAGLAAINNVINTLLISALISITSWHYLVNQLLVTALVVISNFFICKYWIYGDAK